MSSEESLRNDPFVLCIREETGENLPKLESKHLRDRILRSLRVNGGNMTNGEFVDIVAEVYQEFIQRLKDKGEGKKAKFISGMAWAKNYDPTIKKGRNWWIKHVGGEEHNYFIENYVPVFDISKGESGKQGYFEDLKTCIAREAPKALMASKRKSHKRKSHKRKSHKRKSRRKSHKRKSRRKKR